MANIFNNKLTADVGITSTIVYSTNSTTKATVIGINLANKLASNITVDIILEVITGGTIPITETCYVVKNVVIPAGNSLAAIGGDQKLVLTTNNNLKVQSSANNSVDVIVSVLEIT